MLVVRKIDFYFQLGLGILMILSIPILFLFGFGAGLFVLGCWQLLSAGFNTQGFIHSELRNEIKKYWRYSGADLFTLFCCWPLSELFSPDDVQVVFWIGTTAAVPIAIYYMIIYGKLIHRHELKKELSAFTKSKS